MASSTAIEPMLRPGFVPTISFVSLLRSAIKSEVTPVSFCRLLRTLKDSNLTRLQAPIDVDRTASSNLAIRT